MLIIILSLTFMAITIYFLYYLSCIRRDRYWKRRGIPGPKGDTIFGNLKALINPQNPYSFQIREWTRQFGKTYGIREGWRHVLVTSDPNIVHELLVKKFEYFHGRKNNPMVGNVDKSTRTNVFLARGARWKRLRSISSPIFNIANLKKMMPTVADSVNVMMANLNKVADSGENFNIHPYFYELTMDIICRIALGQKGSHQFDNPYVDVVKRYFAEFGVDRMNVFANLVPWRWSIWGLKRISLMTASFRKAPYAEIIAKLYREVEDRKKLKSNGASSLEDGRVDFIDLLLDAETNEILIQNENYNHKSPFKVSKKMTTGEIVAQCFVFLAAGFDTTANNLANIIFFLAKHPECQQKLQEEIDEICPDEEINYEQLQSLKYEDAVMKEVIRMVPIAAFAVSRECTETTTLGDITIEKGTQVVVDVLSLHYDKELWGEDADNFVPERFLNNQPRHPSAWVPFGGGPRTCIGMRLANLEQKLLLAKILKKYNIVACEQTELKLGGAGFGSILNPESVTVKLIKRI